MVGGKSPELRAFCAKEVAGRDSAAVAGFMLEGLDCGVAEPDRTACVRAVLRVLPAAKPRAIRGAFGPFQVLALVEQVQHCPPPPPPFHATVRVLSVTPVPHAPAAGRSRRRLVGGGRVR